MTHLPVTVRHATDADVPIMQLLIGELGYNVDVATLRARFRAFPAAGERALVAERDGRVIGLATLHITPVLHRAGAVGRVTAMVVTKSACGTGVGSALMAEAQLTAAGCVIRTSCRSTTRATPMALP